MITLANLFQILRDAHFFFTIPVQFRHPIDKNFVYLPLLHEEEDDGIKRPSIYFNKSHLLKALTTTNECSVILLRHADDASSSCTFAEIFQFIYATDAKYIVFLDQVHSTLLSMFEEVFSYNEADVEAKRAASIFIDHVHSYLSTH